MTLKIVGSRQAKAALSRCLEQAQRTRILVTKHGKPAALLVGVRGESLEQIVLGSDPGIWTLVEARRRSRATITQEELERRSDDVVETTPPRKPPTQPRSARSRGSLAKQRGAPRRPP